jgi:hypothetical protein
MIATVVACGMCGDAEGLKIKKDLAQLCDRQIDGFEHTTVGQLDRTKRGQSKITSIENKRPQADIIDMNNQYL